MVSESRFYELQEQVKALTERVAKLENSAARAKDRVFVYYINEMGDNMYLTGYDYIEGRLESYGFSCYAPRPEHAMTRREAEQFMWDFEYNNYNKPRTLSGEEQTIELKIMETTL